MEFQIKKVEKGDIDIEELKKQIPGWCSLLKKSPDDERLRIIVASMFYFIDGCPPKLNFGWLVDFFKILLHRVLIDF